MINELEKDLFDSEEELTVYTQDGKSYIIHALTILTINNSIVKFYNINNAEEIICLNPATIIKYTYTNNEE